MLPGRVVRITTDWQTCAAVQDLLEIKLGSAQAGFVLGWKIVQSSLEGTTSIPKHKIGAKRATGSFSSGSGGGTATVVKNQSGDASHGLTTIERNNTTQATAGTGTLENMDPDVMNESAGAIEAAYIPEAMPAVGPAEAFILSFDEAPTSGTYCATVTLLITHG